MVEIRNLQARVIAIVALMILDFEQGGNWHARRYDATDTGVSDKVDGDLVYISSFPCYNKSSVVVP